MLNIGQTSAARSMTWQVYRSASIFSGRILPWLVLAVLATSPAVCAAGDPQPDKGKLDAAQEEFFEAKVRPVLADNCLECHGAEKHKGGLRLDVRAAMLKGGETGPAVVPGKPDESPLIEAIRYEGDVQMPPKKKLKDEEIAALTDWVKRGALWPEPRPGSVPDRSRTFPRRQRQRSHARSACRPRTSRSGRSSRSRTQHRRRSKTRPGLVRRSTGSFWPSSRRTAWRRRRRPTRRP